MTAAAPVLDWDARGVTIVLPAQGEHPARTLFLNHEEVARTDNFDAHTLGLPPMLEAVVSVKIEGRIDVPDFRVTAMYEPFQHQHPWANHRRLGALVTVGERTMRLNLVQMRALEAIDALNAAGDDVAARLSLWPKLSEAVHHSGYHQLVVLGDFPHLRLHQVDMLPVRSMTRVNDKLLKVVDYPQALWSMEAGRRYYLRKNT